MRQLLDCPYREHTLISLQEHEAWDAVLACQGQLQLAPSGHVIGLDMGAALRIGAARGSDLAVLSELLPAAEAGLVEGCCLPGETNRSERLSDSPESSSARPDVR